MYGEGSAMRKQKWFGVIVLVLLFLPSYALGGIIAHLIRLLIAGQLGTTWLFHIFGFELPDLILAWIFVQAIPEAIHGGLAPTIAVPLTVWLYKGPNIGSVTFIVGIIYTLVIAFIIIPNLIFVGPNLKLLLVFCNMFGVYIGLFVAAVHAIGERKTLAES
jgi:hypothetical protein